jgi:PIN domain nuclease of toxin-antitoxin system
VRVLLDTNVLLWWIGQDRRLSRSAADAISSPGNDVLVSSVSVAELAVKASIGRFGASGGFAEFIREQLEVQHFTELDLTVAHSLALAVLPLHHRDPFDRLLIAQAAVEGIPLVASDPAMDSYEIQVIW